jgi:hypothetical protein
MGTELPTKVMVGQKLVLMQMTFLNNVRKVGRLVLSKTPCLTSYQSLLIWVEMKDEEYQNTSYKWMEIC